MGCGLRGARGGWEAGEGEAGRWGGAWAAAISQGVLLDEALGVGEGKLGGMGRQLGVSEDEASKWEHAAEQAGAQAADQRAETARPVGYEFSVVWTPRDRATAA